MCLLPVVAPSVRRVLAGHGAGRYKKLALIVRGEHASCTRWHNLRSLLLPAAALSLLSPPVPGWSASPFAAAGHVVFTRSNTLSFVDATFRSSPVAHVAVPITGVVVALVNQRYFVTGSPVQRNASYPTAVARVFVWLCGVLLRAGVLVAPPPLPAVATRTGPAAGTCRRLACSLRGMSRASPRLVS